MSIRWWDGTVLLSPTRPSTITSQGLTIRCIQIQIPSMLVPQSLPWILKVRHRTSHRSGGKRTPSPRPSILRKVHPQVFGHCPPIVNHQYDPRLAMIPQMPAAASIPARHAHHWLQRLQCKQHALALPIGASCPISHHLRIVNLATKQLLCHLRPSTLFHI